MFRLQDNVPQVYVEQSRDFQLFCRLVDILQNSTKYDIDSIVNLLEPFLTNDRMLELLCTKIGFFPLHHYDANVLRHIISVFPFAVRNKGTAIGIASVVNAIIRAENLTSSDSKREAIVEVAKDDSGGITINVYVSYDIENRRALDDVLRYILPVGCSMSYNIYKEERTEQSLLGVDYKTKLIFDENSDYFRVGNTSVVKSYSKTYHGKAPEVKLYQASPIASQIVSSDIYAKSAPIVNTAPDVTEEN